MWLAVEMACTDFVIQIEEQAKSRGISPEESTDRIVMRIDLHNQ